jgi:hypothetical protein
MLRFQFADVELHRAQQRAEISELKRKLKVCMSVQFVNCVQTAEDEVQRLRSTPATKRDPTLGFETLA